MSITLAERETASFPYTLDPSKIPTKVVVDDRYGEIYYQCPDKQWVRHYQAWCKASNGNRLAPQPLPFNHCMFEYSNIYNVTPIAR